MSETNATAFLNLVSSRRGHFRLESGHHSEVWLNLDSLFADPRRIAPFVNTLANALRPHKLSAVCGPLLGGAFLAQLVAQALDVEFCFTERVMPATLDGLYCARYLLPSAFVARVRGKKLAMVDDVISAGSALRGTFAELQLHGARPVVAGALLVLGSIGAGYFADKAFRSWPPLTRTTNSGCPPTARFVLQAGPLRMWQHRDANSALRSSPAFLNNGEDYEPSINTFYLDCRRYARL